MLPVIPCRRHKCFHLGVIVTTLVVCCWCSNIMVLSHYIRWKSALTENPIPNCCGVQGSEAVYGTDHKVWSDPAYDMTNNTMNQNRSMLSTVLICIYHQDKPRQTTNTKSDNFQWQNTTYGCIILCSMLPSCGHQCCVLVTFTWYSNSCSKSATFAKRPHDWWNLSLYALSLVLVWSC